MPTARKTTARKTTPATPAVNTELEEYKKRVAKEIKYFKHETGDLCDKEYNRLRKELNLESLLTLSGGLRVSFSGDFTVTGADGSNIDPHLVESDIAAALARVLEAGLEFSYYSPVVGTKKGMVKFVFADVDDYSFDHD